jgi:uncharacterized phage protein gp47/JayE
MSSYGIQSTGFILKPLDVILSELNVEFKSIFGDTINLDPESPDGQINGIFSNSHSDLWEIAEECYNAYNPAAAVGTALDNLAALAGLTRLQATGSTASLDLTGVNGTLIPQGSLVEADDGLQFATDADVTIAGGVATVNATATETGPRIALAGSITTIATPVAGWSTVTNPADAVEGTDEETDAELRVRREASVAFPSQALVDSIFSAIANLDGVISVAILENDSSSVDGNGQVPHSVQAVVFGGDDTEIAEAIFQEKPVGIATDGTTTVAVDDIQGNSYNVKFTRPAPVGIYVTVTLTTNSEYPSDGDDLIKQAIVDYAEANFGASEDVIYSRLYTPINSIPGHQIDNLEIGTSPSPSGTSNIAIAFNQISDFDIANIVIT